MNTFQYIIGYHFDNHSIASDIDQKLNRVGFHFDHIHSGNALLEQSIGERINGLTKPFILIVTDNFLKDEDCIYKLFETILTAEKFSRKFIVILADGFLYDPITGQLKEIVTKLQSVGDILYYINYWQDKYLQLRKKYLEEDKSLQVSDSKLKKAREIASEIGELLHKLRNLQPITLVDFENDNFKYFFNSTDHTESFEAYQKMASYDERDAKIERQVLNMVNQNEMEIEQPQEFEENQEEVSILENFDQSKNTQNSLNNQIESTTEKSDFSLLEKLISYKNEVLNEKQTHSEPQQKEPVSVEHSDIKLPESILTSTEKMGQNQNLDKEMTENLGKLLLEKFGEEIEEDFDSEEEEINISNYSDQLKKTILLNPDDVNLRLELVKHLMLDESNFSETADQLEQILKVDKNNIEAIYLIGKLSYSVGEYELAKTYFKKLSILQPDFPGIYYEIAKLIEQHFPKELEESAFYYKKTFDHDTTNLEALEKRAILLYKHLGKPKKAKKILNKLIQWDPFHPTAHYYLAEIYFQADEKEKAIQSFKRAKEITTRLKTEIDTIQETIQEESGILSKISKNPTLSVNELSENIKKDVDSFVCITGATSGIGKATATLLASKGRNLIITGRRKDRLQELAEYLNQKFNVEVEILVFDIRVQADVEEAIQSLKSKAEKIDILINNAGLAMGLDYIHEGNIEHWNTMIDTNIKGLLFMTRMIAPIMVRNQRGHIINICSTAGKEVYPKGNVYCATKFAVDALTKAFRQDLHNHNIRVSQVSPGHTENTEFALVRFEGDEQRSKIYNDFNPLKSEDIANVIDFMINQPAHINIQDILVTSTQQASSTIIDRSGRKFDEG